MTVRERERERERGKDAVDDQVGIRQTHVEKNKAATIGRCHPSLCQAVPRYIVIQHVKNTNPRQTSWD